MLDVSNANNCGGNTNYGLHYTLKFNLHDAGYMSWHTPLDLAWGGMILVDGDIVSQTT